MASKTLTATNLKQRKLGAVAYSCNPCMLQTNQADIKRPSLKMGVVKI